jgi:hypothetical protein
MGLSPKGPIIDHTAIDPLFSRLARYTLDERTGGQMKKLAKIGIGIVVFFVLAYTAVMYFTAGMANTADAFFQSIKKQDIAAARGYLSADFKASTDEAALRAFLSNNALLHFKKASWSNREISGGRGELNGEVISDAGAVIPLKLMFVKENDAWKIYGIQKAAAGLQMEGAEPHIPNGADRVALVKRSMHDFALSINNKSMEHFYATLSPMWQEQITTAKLDEVFGNIYGSGLDFTVLDNLEPVVEPVSSLGENGELILKGYFPSTPNQVHFQHTYVYDSSGWRLLGFDYQIGA